MAAEGAAVAAASGGGGAAWVARVLACMLARRLQVPLSGTTTAEWDERIKLMQRLQALAQGCPPAMHDALLDTLRQLKDSMVAQVRPQALNPKPPCGAACLGSSDIASPPGLDLPSSWSQHGTRRPRVWADHPLTLAAFPAPGDPVRASLTGCTRPLRACALRCATLFTRCPPLARRRHRHAQVEDRRSAVSKQACQLLGTLSAVLGLRFQELMMHMMPVLVRVLPITVQVRAHCGLGFCVAVGWGAQQPAGAPSF